MAAEFYIAPPSWRDPPTEPAFRPFAVPLVAVRQRIAEAVRRAPGTPFFVRYRTLEAAAANSSRGTVREYRRRGGKRTASSDAGLERHVPWFRASLHRFRTFDVAYGPCRH